MSILAESQPSRQGYVSAALLVAPGVMPSRAGEVQPLFFRLRHITGFRPIQGGGMWLNCQFEYQKPCGGGYFVEAACQFDYLARSTGQAYVRSCSCPDALMRVGQKGEMRKCKHMIALAHKVALSVGEGPAVDVDPAHYERTAEDRRDPVMA